MGIDERFDNIDKAINKLYRMFFRLLAILFVKRKVDYLDVEDILNIAKEKEENGTTYKIIIGRLK